jgi:hypothetical protein
MTAATGKKKPALADIDKRIAKAQAELADLDALVVAEKAAEQAAAQRHIDEALGTPVYGVSSAASAHRKKWQKAIDDKETLAIELDLLAQARQAAMANEAARELDKAIKQLAPHRRKLEAGYASAAKKLAALLAEDWPGIVVAFDTAHQLMVQAEQTIVPAAKAVDPEAQSKWNEAWNAFAAFEPVPPSVAALVELLLGALVDPADTLNGGGNRLNFLQPSLRGLVAPDVADRNLPVLTARWRRFSSEFGARVYSLARRVHDAQQPASEPPPPTPEQIQAAKDHAQSVITKFRVEQAKRIETAVRTNNYAWLSDADRLVLAARQSSDD